MSEKQPEERTTMEDVVHTAEAAAEDLTDKAKTAGGKIAEATHVAATTVGKKVQEGGSSAARKIKRAALKLEDATRSLARKVQA